MLSGDVGRKTRSMLANRPGTPRSATSSTGLTAAPTPATRRAARARPASPRTPAAAASNDEAPARPPKKKYQGTSGFHTGGLMTGRS
jgi:hypothetical protein